MGTILTTQAGHTYKVVQSNIGLRVEYLDGGTFAEILIHRPDATDPADPPPDPDPVPPSDTTPPVVKVNRVGVEFIEYTASEAGTAFWLVNDRPGALTGAFIAAGGQSFPVSASGTTAQNIDLRALPPGLHYMHLTVRDAAGNFSADAPMAFERG